MVLVWAISGDVISRIARARFRMRIWGSGDSYAYEL